MNFADGILHIGSFMAATLGIVVLFVGKRLNDLVKPLREFSIPDPVSGGLVFSLLFSAVYFVTGIEIEFDLTVRDILLVYFFTTIGINASLGDLRQGGRPLLILLAITVAYMFLQNLIGMSVAALFGLPSAVGVLGGTISLIGGHGTAVAWAPLVAEQFNVSNALEISIACATFGLVLASVSGGPIARFLIDRHQLKPSSPEPLDVGTSARDDANSRVGQMDFVDAILAIHICVILGGLLHALLVRLGLQLPLFVACLFAGIVVSNSRPRNVRRITGTLWPSRTPAMALIADIALGTFLAMSLMSLQLWTLVSLAGPLLTLLAVQFIVAVAIGVLVVFRMMGRDYNAAVVCAGFGGISLGSTPTAMANMAAVTNKYGGSHLAFIIVPLVCAFFIDLANALVIPLFLSV